MRESTETFISHDVRLKDVPQLDSNHNNFNEFSKRLAIELAKISYMTDDKNVKDQINQMA